METENRFYTTLSLRRRKIHLISEIEEKLRSFTPVHDIRKEIYSSPLLGNIELEEDEYNTMYRLALKRLSDELEYNKEFYLQQSIYRYEKEIQRLIEDSDPETKRFSYAFCLETMKDLEMILGFRDSKVKMKINNLIINRSTQINNLSNSNLEKLSFKDKVDFLELLQKSRLSDLELQISVQTSEEKKKKVQKVESNKEEYTQFEEIKILEKEEEEFKGQIDLHELKKRLQINHLNNQNNESNT